MSTYLPAELRQRLIETDDRRCAYCQTTQFNSGSPMVVDHIIPRSNGGKTESENLCFACHRCNEFKHATLAMEDPLTGATVDSFIRANRGGASILPGCHGYARHWLDRRRT
jgi:hypothetical protein